MIWNATVQSKCKEIIFWKKNNITNYRAIYNIEQHENLTLPSNLTVYLLSMLLKLN